MIRFLEKWLTPDKDYKYTTGADVADSIALIVIMMLVCFMVFG